MIISIASVVVPFALGLGLAAYLHPRTPRRFPSGGSAVAHRPVGR